MKRSVRFMFRFALTLALAGFAAGGLAQGGGGQLQMYTATVDQGVIAKLLRQGHDIARIRRVPGSAQAQVELVLWPHEVAQLNAQHVPLELWRGADSQTAMAAASAQAAVG